MARTWRDTVRAVCVAGDATGVRRLQIRDWHLVGDSGPDFGGWRLGPSSPELLCGVISTCLVHTYLIVAAWADVPVDRVEVEVSAENNDARFLEVPTTDPAVPWNITAAVRLDAPDATSEQVAALHRYVAERCPLTQLIRTPQPLTIVVRDERLPG